MHSLVFSIDKFSPNLNLQNIISTYNKQDFSGKKMTQIHQISEKKEKSKSSDFYDKFQ